LAELAWVLPRPSCESLGTVTFIITRDMATNRMYIAETSPVNLARNVAKTIKQSSLPQPSLAAPVTERPALNRNCRIATTMIGSASGCAQSLRDSKVSHAVSRIDDVGFQQSYQSNS
jgi:hypothetical protein